MKQALVGATVAAVLCVAAHAADDPMAQYYGNTVVSTGGMYEIHTHYRADHTFDMVGSMMMMSKTFKGTWSLSNGKLCRVFVGEMPPDTVNPVCSPFTPHKLGETWTVQQSNGSTRTGSLKPGVI
ncbi:MAG: hypothetical protein JO294_06645 [Alphaproteobacteria bacterium]|nr:hypothetical protein [Alphaproteobacteria bacterium]